MRFSCSVPVLFKECGQLHTAFIINSAKASAEPETVLHGFCDFSSCSLVLSGIVLHLCSVSVPEQACREGERLFWGVRRVCLCLHWILSDA